MAAKNLVEHATDYVSDMTLQSAVEAYAQAEALFSSIGDGAIATDEFGRITKINKAGLEILGRKEKDVLGAWFPKAIPAFNEDGSPIAEIDRPITQAFLTGKPVITKMLYKMKDGSLLPVAVTVSPLVLGDRPIGAIELFRDISVEYEIDRMKSDFISLASHQLRTPLSAIKTYSHMLIDGFMGELEPAQRKALRTIVGASNRMNELISTLLNVSRIESGNVIISPKKVNLNHLTEEVFKELALTAENKRITLTSKLPATPLIIKADNLIAKEVLINLVSNAIKYTPDEGSVEVALRKRASNVIIRVKDSGMGIPKAAREQIFTKFYRAPNVVRQETSGTGLGLYLVKGLIDALGGKIWFESEEGKGSTFFVELPMKYAGRPANTAGETTDTSS
jgi:PAS domain S-box-containing protein